MGNGSSVKEKGGGCVKGETQRGQYWQHVERCGQCLAICLQVSVESESDLLQKIGKSMAAECGARDVWIAIWEKTPYRLTNYGKD